MHVVLRVINIHPTRKIILYGFSQIKGSLEITHQDTAVEINNILRFHKGVRAERRTQAYISWLY